MVNINKDVRDEYNDENIDNFVKHEYIKKAFNAARSAAKGDLLFLQDENSDDYNEYPEFHVDDEDQGFSLKALGAYEKSDGLRTRIDSEIRKDLINEIRTKQQGQPLSQAEDEYFQTVEE